MEYGEIIENIEEVLNRKRERKDQNTAEEFRNLLIQLKEEFGQVLSTYYLRGLIEGTGVQKSKRLRYVLSRAGLDRERHQKFFKSKCYSQGERNIQDYKFSDRFQAVIPKLYWMHFYVKSRREEGFKEISYPLTHVRVGREGVKNAKRVFFFVEPNKYY